MVQRNILIPTGQKEKEVQVRNHFGALRIGPCGTLWGFVVSERESFPPTWFSLNGLRWWEAQTARMTIMMSRAPQEARMAIRVLLSPRFFEWKTQQESYFFSHCSAWKCLHDLIIASIY